MTSIKLHLYKTKEIQRLSLDQYKVTLVQDQTDTETKHKTQGGLTLADKRCEEDNLNFVFSSLEL